jgi:hypothetical protein
MTKPEAVRNILAKKTMIELYEKIFCGEIRSIKGNIRICGKIHGILETVELSFILINLNKVFISNIVVFNNF